MAVGAAIEHLVLAAFVGGLICVIAEILVRDPRLFLDIVTDVRAMAEAVPEPHEEKGRPVPGERHGGFGAGALATAER